MKISLLKFKYDSIISIVFFCFIFVNILDPANTLLHLKFPLFILTVALCLIKKANRIGANNFIILLSVCALTSLLGFLRGVNIDYEFTISIYKSFMFALLIIWAHDLRVIERFKFPVIVVSIIVIFIYICSFLFPQLTAIAYGMTRDPEAPWPIMMSTRDFLGFKVYSVFYKTSPLALFVAAISLHHLFHSHKKKQNALISVLALSVLIMSGTRMNMLSALALLAACIIIKLWETRVGKKIALIISLFSLVCGMALVSLLINDKGEHSLDVKTKLAQSFYNEVVKDPTMLLIGQGAGATFDSLGVRGRFAVQSELTYSDLIRWFGIPLSLIIMCIYTYPLLIMYKKRKLLIYSREFICAYFLYLSIAGTNPLLISSTGMLAMLAMYSYAFNPSYEDHKRTLQIWK